jgi:hypothetical protein
MGLHGGKYLVLLAVESARHKDSSRAPLESPRGVRSGGAPREQAKYG